ncbi:DUF2914 domain-containing protein [Candidatus Desantisbacteria bacterium]|nr:DUF2914 domain-containing protein [Candidatus Desantisbacteria bacterium]
MKKFSGIFIILFMISSFSIAKAEKLKLHAKDELSDIIKSEKTVQKESAIKNTYETTVPEKKVKDSVPIEKKVQVEDVHEEKSTALAEIVEFSSEQKLTVDRGVIAKNVEARTPVGAGESFPVNIEKLYCFTEISGAEHGTRISHAWYRKDKLFATIDLTINTSHTYTWSFIKIPSGWDGSWEVHVLNDKGKVIANIPFKIE